MNNGGPPKGPRPGMPGGPHRGYVPKSERKPFSESFGKLIKYSKKLLPIVIIAITAAACGTVFTLMGPDKLGEMTNKIKDGLISGIDLDGVRTIALTLVAFYSASALLSYTQSFIMATVTQRLTKSMRRDISAKINKLPLKYFDTTSYGDILSRVTNDVDTIGHTLNQSVGSLVSAMALFVGSIFMMFKTNVLLAIVAIASSFLGFALMMIIIKISQKYFMRQQEFLGKINGHVEEVYNGHNVIKVYNAEDKLREEFQDVNRSLYKNAWKSQFISGLMQPLMGFIGNFGYVSVCVAGAALAMNGSISFGVIVAFIIYVRLFSQPLSTMAQAATSLQSAGAASYRVFEFLDEKELLNESTKNKVLDTVRGEVSFKNVQFGYDESKLIINDFSAEVKAGQKIAIVGPTGAGKTTMVNLLMRFYEINKGQITVDNVSIDNLRRENIHDLFCMVLQDTWIFEGTIKQNIVYNKKNVSDDDIITVCKAVGIHHFIKTLPQGYDTVLNENASISAGQKQLITIARAMIKNAPMLILDEATSSVDTRTEILIQQAMDKLMHGRTSFIIAHRLSTIKNADKIFVMNSGDILESGTHIELLEQDGFYAALYNSQFDQIA